MKHTLLLLALFAMPALAYERLQGPTELLLCNKQRAFNGYTLFGVGGRTYLLDMEGRVVHIWPNPPDAGYRRENYDHDTHNEPRQISTQIVWSYRSVNSHGFFSHIGSSAQRLPNGTTFICSDTEGHFFEVTAGGELVWEYINPVTRDGAVKVLGDVLPMTNSVFRACRLAADHPALKGRELTPKGTITERAAQGLDTQPRRRPEGDRSPTRGDANDRRGQGGGFRVIPRPAAERMNLSADQLKQVTELEQEAKAKLDKILTPEQRKALDEARRSAQGGRQGPGAVPQQ